MKAENWKTVKELLQEVLQIEPLRRHKFLEAAVTSGEVLSEVESLLELAAESENFMSLALEDYSKDLLAETEVSLVGQRIGIYEISREIGFGGMGAVYLATRADGKFEQRVAIKMLKREFNIEKIRHIFRREKEILAKLSHPNIARLLDAGTTTDGVPYLVMEFIEGVPIDKFCEQNNVALNARLKLFNKVCEAVSFAHRNLIVHRDLKPSNILVTEKGEPKLLDFGISKLLDAAENLADQPTTLLGAMTPEYASPEQIRGEIVSTATDIYSLGVVLYKILTNALPFDLKHKTNGDLLKTITENEPIAPSFSLEEEKRRRGEKEKNSGGKIASSPLRLFAFSQLSGDIDNIILKSLRKEPARRYQTVEQFSADIWRYIDGLPVLARPATVSYRASKFFQRNKIAVIAAVLIFLSLITGIFVAFRQTRVAEEQARNAVESQNLAERETEHAKAEERKSEKISRFMSKIISYANPLWYAEGAKFGGDARVIDALNDLSGKIDTEFADEPDVAAELHHRFTEAFGANAGSMKSEEQRERILFHARRALELRKRFYGERHELVAKDMVYLYWAGGVEESQQANYLMAAIEMMRETNPNNLNLPYMLEGYSSRLMMPGTPQTHEAYRQVVTPPTDENKYQIGERLLREALPIFRFHYKEDNLAIWVNECRLAYALAMQDKWTDFDEHYAICKQGGEKIKDGDSYGVIKLNIELVEKALAAKTNLR